MLMYLVTVCALVVDVSTGHINNKLHESLNCKDTTDNSKCVGHNLQCGVGEEIYLISGHYIFTKAEAQCNVLPAYQCIDRCCISYDIASCNYQYSSSDMNEAVSTCNGKRSCSLDTPMIAPDSSCVYVQRHRYYDWRPKPETFNHLSMTYISYMCVKVPVSIEIGSKPGAVLVGSGNHVVVKGSVNEGISCTITITKSRTTFFMQWNHEGKPLHLFDLHILKSSTLYKIRSMRSTTINVVGPVHDLLVNIQSVYNWSWRNMVVTSTCKQMMSSGAKTPVSTTEAPVPTTEAPVPITEAPVPTTEAQAHTTKVPVSATRPHVSTTKVPVPTTRVLVSTTNVPFLTTTMSDSEITSDVEEIEEVFNNTNMKKTAGEKVVPEKVKYGAKIVNWRNIVIAALTGFAVFIILISLLIVFVKRRLNRGVKKDVGNGVSNPTYDDSSMYQDSAPPSYSKVTGLRIPLGYSQTQMSAPPSYSKATNGGLPKYCYDPSNASETGSDRRSSVDTASVSVTSGQFDNLYCGTIMDVDLKN